METNVSSNGKDINSELQQKDIMNQTNKRNEYLQQILEGALDIELPSVAKIVRIFTSSTFTDTKHERNILMEKAYPKLKEFCKSKGYEFQVVDMRWGVRDEATADHMTTEMCLKEIEACKNLSTGPNFVTFLSHKYGYRPFPRRIEEQEFESIANEIYEEDEKRLLHKWFECDYNNVPAMYTLQPIYKHLPDYNITLRGSLGSKEYEALQKRRDIARSLWWSEFCKLQAILRKGSKKAFGDTNKKYMISVTEDEIQKGILTDEEPNKHCLWFNRVIDDLDGSIADKRMCAFIDTNEGYHVDEEAQNLLNQLKNKKLSVLNENNISIYHINCKSDSGINPQNENHADYLKWLCDEFESKMKTMITKAIKDKGQFIDSSLIEEIVQHAQTCKGKIETFHGREVILKRIQKYINTKFGAIAPLIVHGKSGIGKTSVLAKAYEIANHKHKSFVFIVRFLGTTTDSSTVSKTLYSICCQIIKAYKLDMDVPEEFKKLVALFKELLNPQLKEIGRVYDKKPLIVFIDSVDQLSNDDEAYSMQWLPTKLHFNVRVVLTTLTAEGYQLYDNLKMVLPTTCFVEVNELPVETGMEVLDTWLSKKSRTLREDQKESVKEKFSACPSPLFLKISLEHVGNWKSYDDISETQLENNVNDAINRLFSQLEQKHGRVFTSHALGLLTASKNGLSDAEIEDLCSLDNEVLKDVYQYWEPPICRIPPMLWVRLRTDIGPFIVTRGHGGRLVNMWYHRQFIETAKERYLMEEDRIKYTNLLIEYFLGTWSNGKKKPFSDPKDKRDRLVSMQPIVFASVSKNTVYNYRMLDELPYHLLNAGNLEDIKEHFLFNFNFLISRSYATGYLQLLEDIKKVLNAYPHDNDVKMISECLILFSSALRDDIDQLPNQLIGRYSHLKNHYPMKLLADAKSSLTPCLYPTKNIYVAPDKYFKGAVIGHTKPVTAITMMSNRKEVASVGHDYKLRISNISTYSEHHCFPILKKRVKRLFATQDGTAILLVTNMDIHLLDVQTGNINITYVFGAWKFDCDFSKDRRMLAVVGEFKIDVFHCRQAKAIFQYSKDFEFTTSDKENLVAAGTKFYAHRLLKNKLSIRDFESGSVVKNLTVGTIPECFAFSEDGSRLVVIERVQNELTVMILLAESWEIVTNYKAHGNMVSNDPITVSQLFSGMEIIWSSKQSINFWNVESGSRRNHLQSNVLSYGQLAVTDESLLLVAQGNDIAIYDLQLIDSFIKPNDIDLKQDIDKEMKSKKNDDFKKSCFDENNWIAAVTDDDKHIQIWNMQNETEIKYLPCNVMIEQIPFLDEIVIFILSKGSIHVFDHQDGSVVACFNVEFGYTIIEQTRELLTLVNGGAILIAFDYHTGVENKRIDTNTTYSFTKNNCRWFSSNDGRQIVIERNGLTHTFIDVIEKTIYDKRPDLGEDITQSGKIQAVFDFEENSFLLSIEHNQFSIWDIKNMSLVENIQRSRICFSNVSSNGQYLIFSQMHFSGYVKGIFVYSVKTMTEIAEYNFPVETIVSVTGRFSKSGKVLMLLYSNVYKHQFAITFDSSFSDETELKLLAKLSLGNLQPINFCLNDDHTVFMTFKEHGGISVFKRCGK